MCIENFVNFINKNNCGFKPFEMKNFKNNYVFIDMSLLFFRFLTTNNFDQTPSLIKKFIISLSSYNPKKIILILEGKKFNFKKNTIKIRKTRVHNRELKLKKELEDADMNDVIRRDKLEKTIERINNIKHIYELVEIIKQDEDILKLTEIYQSTYEDYGVIEYARENNITKYMVITNDIDFIVYGGGEHNVSIIKNVSFGKVNKTIYLNSCRVINNLFKGDYKKLFMFCSLLKNDYNIHCKIKGIGPVNAYDMVKKYENIHEIISYLQKLKKFQEILTDEFLEKFQKYYKFYKTLMKFGIIDEEIDLEECSSSESSEDETC